MISIVATPGCSGDYSIHKGDKLSHRAALNDAAYQSPAQSLFRNQRENAGIVLREPIGFELGLVPPRRHAETLFQTRTCLTSF